MALLIAPLFTAGIALGGIQNANAGISPVCIDSPPNLVSWWPLDETSGTLAGDIADGNDGTHAGDPTPIAGKVDGALDFDGTGDLVNAGNPVNLRLSTGTVDAWIKTSDAGSSFRGIAVKNLAYGMFLKDNVFGIFDWGTSTFRTTGINLADGQFHHVAFTFQSGVASGTVLYIDGVAQLTTQMTVRNQNIVFTIGSNFGVAQNFNGIIDEVEVFDRVLTPTEIEEIFDADDDGKCKDAVPPDTTIDSMPTDPTNDNTPTFGFSGTDADSGVASFECDLDGGGFTACSSTKTLAALGDGSHTFQVRAIDNAGNTDPTPASYTWVTDATPPDTTIDSKVDGNGIDLSDMTTVSTGAEFTFSGTDATSGVASFECNINSTGWVVCTSSKVYAGLSPGNNTFEVRAIDNAGNTDPTPASFAWTIQTPGAASDELIQDIKDLGFDKKIEKSLIGPLKKISKILNDGNPDNDQAACDKLTEFLDNLAAKADKIDDAGLVDALEADAQGIKDEIGCPIS